MYTIGKQYDHVLSNEEMKTIYKDTIFADKWFDIFLEQNGLTEQRKEILDNLDFEEAVDLGIDGDLDLSVRIPRDKYEEIAREEQLADKGEGFVTCYFGSVELSNDKTVSYSFALSSKDNTRGLFLSFLEYGNPLREMHKFLG